MLRVVLMGWLSGCAERAGPPDSAGTPEAPFVDDDGGSSETVPPADAVMADAEPPWGPPVSSSATDASSQPAGDEAAAGDDDAAAPPLDTVPDAACDGPLGPGNVAIDELMIESVAGAGDDGEWLEVESTVDCAVNLRGLHGECARGAKVTTFDVADDLWLAPRGRFVVADSGDPAINHYLPGTVVTWFGHPGDVLRNAGATVTLSVDGALLDTLTYPAHVAVVGASIAFPDDCDAASRSDWTQWRVSTSPWFPGFTGTPNAPNDDVHCP